MPQLYLIRHGQSVNNALFGESPRTADPCLTGMGQAQARRVAEHLRHALDKPDVRDGLVNEKGQGIGRLYCSPMLRALETARPIGVALGLTPRVWVDVHEGGGVWVDRQDGHERVGHGGLTRSEMETRFPEFEIGDLVTDSGWWNGSFERREEFSARAARVAGQVQELLPGADEPIAIVTHGTFLSVLIQHLLFGTHLPGVRFGTYNTGISRLDFHEDRLAVMYLNRVEHLSTDLVT